MDHEDDLPTFAPPPSMKPAKAEGDDLPVFAAPAPRKAELTTPQLAADVGASAISGLYALPESLPGVPGSLVRAGEYIGDRLRTGYENWKNQPNDSATPTRTPEQIDAQVRAERAAKRASRGETDDWVKLGPVSLPTMGGALKMNPGAPGNYEPKSWQGHAAKTGANTAAGAVLTPGVGVMANMTRSGAVAGATLGEAYKDKLPAPSIPYFGVHDDEVRSLYPMAGGVVGGLAAAGAKPVLGLKTGSVSDKISNGLADVEKADRQALAVNPKHGPTLTPSEAQALRDQGVPVPSYMLMGPGGRDFLVEQAGKNPALHDRLTTINDEIARNRDMQPRLDALEQHITNLNNQTYRPVMTLPHAQNVWSPALEKLYNQKTMKPFIEEAQRLAEQKGDTVSPPVWRDAVAPEGARISIEPGNVWTHAPEVPGTPAGWQAHPETPPNLRFHDYVKRAMDAEITRLYAEPGGKTKANALASQRQRLLDETDRMVPEYPTQARAVAEERFKKLQAAKDFAAAAGQVPGFDLPSPQPPAGWLKRAASAVAAHPGAATGLGGLAGLALDAGGLLEGMPLASKVLSTAGPWAVGAGVAASPILAARSIRRAITAEKQAKANSAISDRLLQDQSALPLDERGAPPLTITPRRAAGGEIGPKPRGKINVDSLADQLVASVEKARAEISGQTEQNLALPDTHVVHALHVAKHALG